MNPTVANSMFHPGYLMTKTRISWRTGRRLLSGGTTARYSHNLGIIASRQRDKHSHSSPEGRQGPGEMKRNVLERLSLCTQRKRYRVLLRRERKWARALELNHSPTPASSRDKLPASINDSDPTIPSHPGFPRYTSAFWWMELKYSRHQFCPVITGQSWSGFPFPCSSVEIGDVPLRKSLVIIVLISLRYPRKNGKADNKI